MQVVHNVTIGCKHTFRHIDNRTDIANYKLANERAFETVSLLNDYQTLNMKTSKFFSLIENKSERKYLYFYGKLPEQLKDDILPYNDLWLQYSDESQFGAFLWLSGTGTRPPLHFDADHNFYVHILGKKKWIFFPPTETFKLYPFPRLHPSWHKSQVDTENPHFQSMPEFRNAIAFEADLQPGDLLYSPPYWWHQPISVTDCISIASWSELGSWSGTLGSIHYEREMVFERESLSFDQKLFALKHHTSLNSFYLRLL